MQKEKRIPNVRFTQGGNASARKAGSHFPPENKEAEYENYKDNTEISMESKESIPS